MPERADPPPTARPAVPTPTPRPAVPHPTPRRAVPTPDVEQPVLPDRAREDSDAAWGDREGDRDADWYRRERPPHHGD